MLKIKDYIKPESLEEAYRLYQNKNSVVLGGMLWLKLQTRPVDLAIDLGGLHLDQIEETDQEFRIGAMVSLRALETNPGLNQWTQGAFSACLAPIIGVQFRNLATIGGSICGKFGFSDPITLLLALGAKVELFHRGILPLEEFLNLPNERDILVHVLLPKTAVQAVYLSQRNTATDFPVLTCAVCRRDGRIVCSIGCRPSKALLCWDEEGVLADGITEENAAAFANHLAETVPFGSNQRGSAEYRKRLCAVLVRRGLLSLKERL